MKSEAKLELVKFAESLGSDLIEHGSEGIADLLDSMVSPEKTPLVWAMEPSERHGLVEEVAAEFA